MWESHSICVWAVAVLTFGVILGIFMEQEREEEKELGRYDGGLLLFIVKRFLAAFLIFIGAFLLFVLAGMLP